MRRTNNAYADVADLNQPPRAGCSASAGPSPTSSTRTSPTRVSRLRSSRPPDDRQAATPSHAPWPLQKTGVKRGDHGSYVAPETRSASSRPRRWTPIPREPSKPSATRQPERSNPRPDAARPVTDAAATAKAAYDPKSKVIRPRLDEDVDYRLRATCKHQLRSPAGIENWSEFGRHLLRSIVDQYEKDHGELASGEHVQLPAGCRMGH